MEILRFDEEQAPRFRKRKSSIGWVLTGVVAVTLGLGSAFATTTITVNGNAPISLGQGVASTATCDNEIGLMPNAALDPLASVTDGTLPVFLVSSLTLSRVDTTGFDSTSGLGCGGKAFKLDFYSHNGTNGNLITRSCTNIVSSGDLKFTYNNSDGSTHSAITDLKCSGDSLYVRIPTVANSLNNLVISGFVIDPATVSLDYITLVSTEYPA